MKKYDGFNRSGRFTIDGKELSGNLILDRGKSSLTVYAPEEFNAHNLQSGSITGVLQDGNKVTLVGCLTGGTGSGFNGEYRYSNAVYTPHYVVFGHDHLASDGKHISKVHFIVDDATTLFHDFDAFGHVIDATPFIDQLVKPAGERLERTIVTGPDPHIFYFTGKRKIIEADTDIGRIAATHNLGYTFPSAKGFHVDNSLYIGIDFPATVDMEECINRVLILLRFIEVVVGRPQNILKLNLTLDASDERSFPLDVYWCRPPHRDQDNEDRAPHPIDILIDGVKNPSAFASVLKNWISREPDWGRARVRFSQGFGEQNSYYIHRLVGAANMFDILPSSVWPPAPPLTTNLEDARRQCREIFKALPDSLERNRILGELGRLGQLNLKQKVRHRAKIITDAAGTVFPELELVVDEAVNCRNYFVHGGKSRIDYLDHFNAFYFLTNTLEIVFATSDLIEAGWDIQAWIKSGSVASHPFGSYKIDYRQQLQALKALLPKAIAAE